MDSRKGDIYETDDEMYKSRRFRSAKKPEKCDVCDGRGYHIDHMTDEKVPCWKCGGKGK